MNIPLSSINSKPPTSSNFINKKEEKALDILEHNKVDWSRQNNISDSDGFELRPDKKRSDTFSMAHSDSHDQKRNKLGEISEGILLQEFI